MDSISTALPPLILFCLGMLWAFLSRYLKKRRGFSLKFLLLAMTVVALLLGSFPTVTAWIQRRNAIQQVRWAFTEVKQSDSPHYFQRVRHQKKEWIIARRKMQIWQENGKVTSMGYSEPFVLHEEREELWVTPPGKWIRSADEAIALIEPQFDTN